jgi:glycogen synthase
MRILMVSEDIPQPQLGGLGKHVLALASELHSQGHEVDILGNSLHPIAALPEQRGPGRFFAEITGHQRLFKERELGVFLPWRPALNARTLRSAILRHSPGYDVIHYHGHMPWVAASLPSELPFLQTRHDQGGDCWLNTRFARPAPADLAPCRSLDPAVCANCATPLPGPLQRSVTATAVRRIRRETANAYHAHPVVFVSDFLRQGFARAAGSPTQGEVVHNGVDLATLRRVACLPPLERASSLEVFAAGAMTPYKGFGALLDALRRRAPVREFRLTLAGDGPEIPRLRTAAEGLPVRLLGWAAYEAVLHMTRSADVVVVPSLWDEPCATTVLEALALGRAVLALKRGGTPELTSAVGPAGHRLCLFDTMDDLVSAVFERRWPTPEDPLQSLNDFACSIESMVKTLLMHYRQLRRTPSSHEGAA